MLKTLLSFFQPPCTLWFNRWGSKSWAHCCDHHDVGYEQFELDYDRAAYKLMLEEQFELDYDRAAYQLMCDEELRDCVNEVMPGMGTLMFKGVHLFGRFFM